MTRTLQFDATEKARSRFQIVYQGLLSGGTERKGIDVIRREARLLEKLEAISAPVSDKDPTRTLQETGGALVLDGPEYDLLLRYIEQTPWVVRVSPQVVDVVDWIQGTPREE